MSEQWRRCALGDFVELKRGYDLPTAERRSGAVPIVSSSGPSGWHDEARVKAPGVVTGRYGTIGHVFFIERDFWPLNTTLYVRDFKGNDERFVSYFLRSLDFQSYNDKSSVPGLNRNDLHREPVLVPPRSEQERIAAVLGALDDKIGQNQRTIRALEDLARATFKAWFVNFEPVRAKAAGALSFPGMPPAAFAVLPNRFTESSRGVVPEGWKLVDVYDLATVVYGAPFASKLFNSSGDGRPLIRIRDLQTHSPSVSTTERHAKGTLIRPGDIVVGMDGEFRLHYWTGPEAWLNQRLCSFQPRPAVPTMYLGEALRAPLDLVERSEAATTVIHLGKSDIDQFQLLRPDDSTLAAFDSITSPMLMLMVQMASESSKLDALRDYLLPRLLSGRLRVRGA